MGLHFVSAIVGARAVIEVGPRRDLNGRAEAEAVVDRLRERVRQAALDATAQSLPQIDEQSFVANEAEVRTEGVADDRRVPAERTLTEDIRRPGNPGVP